MIYIGNQTACWASSPCEPFDYAVGKGFDAFEWFPDKKNGGGWDEEDLDIVRRRNIQETARAHGMRLSVHARWQANPLEPASSALLEKDLELAGDLGAALLNIHLYQEGGIPAYVEAVRPLILRAAESGLQLSIENTPSHSPEDFNELFRLLRLRDLHPASHVGMCLDLGHANLCAVTRNDYLQFLDRLAPHVPIIHVHLHENYGDADTHLPLFTGPAGRDDSGIRGLLARLRRRNFTGSMILEQWPSPPSLLNQARDKLVCLLDEMASVPSAKGKPSPALAPALDDFAQRLVDGDRSRRSWREKLDFIRELLVSENLPLTTGQLVDMAIYLRFLGTGEIPCVEDGRHFRPSHHAHIALQIQERLAKLSSPETAYIIRKIYPWLPSSSPEFQRAEPLTRIRDIAHRNDIPLELKREIKHSLQNKLHRCAGPEDLVTSAKLLERITAAGADYAPAFVEQFRIFHEELREFFNAHSLEMRLEALLPAVGGRDARLIHKFLADKSQAAIGGRFATFVSLTELRRGIIAEAQQIPALERHEFLLADIGLEDFAFVLLSETVNNFGNSGGGANWEMLLEILHETIANLELSHVEPEECRVVDAELRTWRAAFVPADREQLLRLKATVSRIRRLADSYSDRIMKWFPQRAQTLGHALGVPKNAVQIFAEAEIRGHLIFQLSKLASIILRRIREDLALPAWDVVVAGQAAGRMKLVAQLEGNFPEPVLLLLENAEGDEEIPAGVVGIVLAHDLPHLSHLGVRARQAGVILVACEEAARFEELKCLVGKITAMIATTEKVDWQPAEAAVATAARAKPVSIPRVGLMPELLWMPLEQAVAGCGGNKADGVRRLAELARQPGADFKVPAAMVVPFGAMEQAMHAAPGIEAEYGRILTRIDTATDGLPVSAKQLRGLIEQLDVPETISEAVVARFPRHTRLIVRSSANDEDLQNLAGAGLYESVANVLPAEASLAVRCVWASLWTRRAVLSRMRAGIPQSRAHMAVLIQQMLVPDFSFILHSVNPINCNQDEAYAEIVVGLGETLASAATRGNPWRLVCGKKSGSVTTLAFASFSDALWPNPDGSLMRKIVDYSNVPLSLNPGVRKQLGRRLAGVAHFVETAFHEAQDIEGVIKGDEIYLVQSRPQQGLEESK